MLNYPSLKQAPVTSVMILRLQPWVTIDYNCRVLSLYCLVHSLMMACWKLKHVGGFTPLKYVVFDGENSFIVLICGCEFQGFHSSVTGHSSNLGCDIVLHSWHFEGMCCFHLGTNEDEVDTFLPNVGSHLTQWSSALHSRRPHLSTVSYSFTSVLWWF